MFKAARRSRTAHFRAPFLVSVASAAAGCGARTLAEDAPALSQSAGTPFAEAAGEQPMEQQPTPMPTCSGTRPVSSSCGAAVCVNGQWQSPVFNCRPNWIETSNPPIPLPPPCLPEIPAAGSACATPGQLCHYPGCQGPASDTARCEGTQWLLQRTSGPDCDPPAATSDAGTNASAPDASAPDAGGSADGGS